MTAPRNVNRCSPCLAGEHRRCTGSAGNVGCGCIHAAPVPQHAVRAEREGRCPDGGYCHGSNLAAGSEPCPEGGCLRVRTSGPLSGVYPGDRWPAEVRRANGVEPAAARITPAHRLAVRQALGGARVHVDVRNALAQAFADEEQRVREEVLRPFRELFSGGPDTPCRTTWRGIVLWDDGSSDDTNRQECVEVPLDEVRAAFAEAGEEP